MSHRRTPSNLSNVSIQEAPDLERLPILATHYREESYIKKYRIPLVLSFLSVILNLALVGALVHGFRDIKDDAQKIQDNMTSEVERLISMCGTAFSNR